MSHPKPLSKRQLSALNKLGDVLIPGDGEMPAFSTTGAGDQIHRITEYLYEDDRQGVRMLLGLFSFMPKLAILMIMGLSERDHWFPRPISAGLRMINLGLKGIIFTLYYSDVARGGILEKLDWHTAVDTSHLHGPSPGDEQDIEPAVKGQSPLQV